MEKKITGIMIYYYQVCKRKLWYFYNEIQMEEENQNVIIGKILDEESYQRDEKHINIDNVINIDFIRTKGVLHEVKKSRNIEEASILQVKYYLYYLDEKGVSGINGKIDYPLLKESIEVELTQEDRVKIKVILEDVEKIVLSEQPAKTEKQKICKSCAYYDLCYI